MEESLQFVKDAVDEQNTLVKKEDVENDIDLMKAVWYMYHENEEFNKALDDRNIYRGGAYHREAVIQGAKHIVDAQRTKKLVDDLENKLGESEQDRENFVNRIFDEFISEEDKQRLIEQDRELANSVNVFRQNYEKYKNAAIRDNKRKLAQWIEKHQDEYFFYNNDDIKEYAEQNGFYLDDLYNNESRKDKALKYAYQKEQERSWYSRFDVNFDSMKQPEIVQAFEQFLGNQYINRLLRNSFNYTSGFEEYAFNIFKNTDSRKEFLDKAYAERNDGILSEKDYVLDRLRGLQEYRSMQAIDQALKVVKDREKFLKYIKSEFGYDVNPEKLQGIASGLKSMLDTYKRREDVLLNGPKKGRPEGVPTYTFADVFRDMDVHLGNEDEIMKMS
jgi:hypothetical protein